ncbi:MAG TPA: PEPxxWA-CTERM sorting domain-containing protein [Sphingomonas sp.]|nr:PEPxxWA-CTERM sorting domain-containing protein [Sphingomonas sp.]
MKKIVLAALATAAVIASVPAHAINLVNNGGFETGNFTGWTQFDNTGFTVVTGATGNIAPHGGQYQAVFGAVGSTGGITQTLNTVVGETYSISLWAANEGGTPNFGSVSFGGILLGSLTDAPAFDYTNYTFQAVATSASTALSFSFRNDPSYYHLDDVSVESIAAAVPEPATWAMMLLGFGMTGAAMRYRRRETKVAYA